MEPPKPAAPKWADIARKKNTPPPAAPVVVPEVVVVVEVEAEVVAEPQEEVAVEKEEEVVVVAEEPVVVVEEPVVQEEEYQPEVVVVIEEVEVEVTPVATLQEEVAALAAAIQPISLSQLEESMTSSVAAVEVHQTPVQHHHVPINTLKAGEIRLGKLAAEEDAEDDFSFGGFDAAPLAPTPAPQQVQQVVQPVQQQPQPVVAAPIAAAPTHSAWEKASAENVTSAPQVLAPPAPVDSLLTATAGQDAHHHYVSASPYGQQDHGVVGGVQQQQSRGAYGEDFNPPPGFDAGKQERRGNNQRNSRGGGGQGGMQQQGQQPQQHQQQAPQQQTPQQQPYYSPMMNMGMGMGGMPMDFGGYYPTMAPQATPAASAVPAAVGGAQSQGQSAPMQTPPQHQQQGGFYPPYGYNPYFPAYNGYYGYPYSAPQQQGRSGGYQSYGGGAQGYETPSYGYGAATGGRGGDMSSSYMQQQPAQATSAPKSQGPAGGQGAGGAPQSSQQSGGLYGSHSSSAYGRPDTGYSTGGGAYWPGQQQQYQAPGGRK